MTYIDAHMIPTGVEADEVRIAERIADPADPLTLEQVPEAQRPTQEQIDAAASEQPR